MTRLLPDPPGPSNRNPLCMAISNKQSPNAGHQENDLHEGPGNIHGRQPWPAQDIESGSEGICRVVALYVMTLIRFCTRWTHGEPVDSGVRG